MLLHGVEIFLGMDYLGTEVVTGDARASACVASGLVVGDDAASVAAGDVTTVTVHARDARGNALITGGSSFSVLARSGDVALAPSSLVDRRDGTYLATLAPVVSGTYALAITRGGEHIHGSPFALTVVPGLTSASASYLTCASSATNCALRGDAVAGEEASFRVVAKDAHNNTNDRTTEVGGDSFFYSVIGEGGYVKWAVASAASDGAPGAYDGSFLTNVSGAVTIRVTLGAALVRETTASCVRVFFHPRNPPSSRTACRTPSRARRTR